MKKMLLVCGLVLLGMAAGTAVAADSKPYKEDFWGFRWDRNRLALEKALEDIAANRRFIVAVRDEFGESRLLEWGIPVADRLPGQPVAVIQLMAELDIPVRDMCPRMVIEDMLSDYEYDRWMERAAGALESFTMADAKEEGVRRACLENIRVSLAKSPLRQKGK